MRPSLAFTGLLLVALLTPALVTAKGDHGRGRDGRPPAEAPRGGDRVSPGQAADMARRQSGGRVLSVDGGQNGYRVKVLTPSGEVRYLSVPPGR
jgi:hypothetical protein